MKGNVVKRGRPKKDAVTEIALDAVSRSNKIAISKEKAKTKLIGSLGVNRVYVFRDGSSCLVCYGNNKNKPEIVTFGKSEKS